MFAEITIGSRQFYKNILIKKLSVSCIKNGRNITQPAKISTSIFAGYFHHILVYKLQFQNKINKMSAHVQAFQSYNSGKWRSIFKAYLKMAITCTFAFVTSR